MSSEDLLKEFNRCWNMMYPNNDGYWQQFNDVSVRDLVKSVALEVFRKAYDEGYDEGIKNGEWAGRNGY